MEPNPMIDYDIAGHCVICHKNMIIEAAIDGKIQKRFLPDYDETNMLLDDGSQMRVATCRNCKYFLINNPTPEALQNVMDIVINGWDRETDEYVKGKKNPTDGRVIKWTQKRKDKHMEVYKKKKIVVIAEHKAPDTLKKDLDTFKAKQAIKKKVKK